MGLIFCVLKVFFCLFRSGFFVSLLMVSFSSYAGSLAEVFSINIESGKVHFDKEVKASSLEAKGYSVNKYIRAVDEDSNAIGISVGGGFSLSRDDHRIVVNDEVFDNDDTSVSPYLNVGVSVDLTSHFAFTVQAERYFYDNTIDRYSVGLSYTY